jgi:hypothetical protein
MLCHDKDADYPREMSWKQAGTSRSLPISRQEQLLLRHMWQQAIPRTPVEALEQHDVLSWLSHEIVD